MKSFSAVRRVGYRRKVYIDIKKFNVSIQSDVDIHFTAYVKIGLGGPVEKMLFDH